MNINNRSLLILSISGATLVNCLPIFHSIAHAGIIGDIDKKAQYVEFGSSENYPWVGMFLPLNFDKTTEKVKNNGRSCTSTIVHASEKYGIWGLTAGHCLYDRTDKGSVESYNSGAMFFGNDNTIDKDKSLLTKDVIVKKEYIASVNNTANPLSVFLDEVSVDIALVKLTNPDPTKLLPDWLSSVTKPIPKIPKSSLVQDKYIGNFVGVGDQGNGFTGILGSGIYSDNYLGGQNYVSVLNKFLLYDLDGIKPSTNTDGKPALSLEYSPTSGDSGSPVFINGLLAGVHSRSQGKNYVCTNEDGELDLCQLDRGKYGTLGYALKTDRYSKWISDVITGYKPGNAVSLKNGKGGKIIFKPTDKSPKPTKESDTIEFELPDNHGFYVFDPSEDTFRNDYSDEEFNTLYAEAVTNNTPDPDDDNGGGDPDSTQVPEADNVIGLSTIGLLILLSKLCSTIKFSRKL